MIHSSKGVHELQRGFKTLYDPINDPPTCFGSATRGPSYWVICNLGGGPCFVATLLSRLTMSLKTTF